jgi:N-methylhydantoinase B
MTAIDPIQLEVLRNALVAASEEMSVTIWRTSRSTVVREMLDYSTAVFDADGRNVAQATRIPVHLNSMATCLDDLLRERAPISAWQDGDVLITNDPYCGGQHLPDILAYRPVFVDGKPAAIVGALCHHIDVGGGAPGSYDALATEIYQEGLRIPPVKLYAAGVRNQAVFDMILQNSREAEKVAGDLASQVAALEVGATEVARIAGRYGTATLRAAGDAILDQSEQAMRAALRSMPDGVYEFEDCVDDDGITDEPLRIHVTLTIRGDAAAVDFTGSSPQAAGSVNCTLNMSKSAVYFAVMSAAGGDFAANSGCYRPIDVIAPLGTVVNCRHPAPVANRMATGHRVVNTVMGALAQVVPDRIPAAYYGVSYVYTLGSERENGDRDVYLEIEVGGWGAHPECDGANAFSAGFHNLANSPLEMIESAYPVTFTAYGLTPDSGGAGKTRGGLGLHREWRLDAPRGVLSTSFERFRFAPYGLAGGEDGPLGRLYVRRNGEREEPGAKVTGLALTRGDTVRLETSGGGGFGDPKERSAADVERDLQDGYVTPGAAKATYGSGGPSGR